MVDQLLGGLFGAQDRDDEPTRRRRAHDFVDRYERGAHDQLGDDEVLQNYRAATSHLSPERYQQAAADVFQKMSPEEHREMRKELRRRSKDRFDAADALPRKSLAHAMQRAGQENQGSGGLAGLFGLGKSDSGDGNPQEGGIDAMISNPLVKIAVAGIAAMAAKELTEPRG